jgi:hypothetical protein
METLWKCLLNGMKSNHGDCVWEIGVWKNIEAPLSLCGVGFHASPTPIMAMRYVKPGFICKVEVSGDCIKSDDKSCHESMRIVNACNWEKEDSVSLAIFAAELVIDIYEKENPGNKCPRKAIDAAKKWLNNPTNKNRNAADAADAADAAYAAANAAYAADAAYAANAAYAAANAADAAANAAYAAYAADAAYAAAYAAKQKIIDKCNEFIINRLN